MRYGYLLVLIVFLAVVVSVQAAHFSYGGTNPGTCRDMCVTGHIQTLEHAYACPGVCAGIIAGNQPQLPPCNVQCATFCTKVHTASYCGCSCPTIDPTPTPISPTPISPTPITPTEITPTEVTPTPITPSISSEDAEAERQRKLAKKYMMQQRDLQQQLAIETENRRKEQEIIERTNEAATDMKWRLDNKLSKPVEKDCDSFSDPWLKDYLGEVKDIMRGTVISQGGGPVLASTGELYQIQVENNEITCYGFADITEADLEEEAQRQKESEALDEISEQLRNDEVEQKEVDCASLKDARSMQMISNVHIRYAETKGDVSRVALTANNEVNLIQKVDGKLKCYEFPRKRGLTIDPRDIQHVTVANFHENSGSRYEVPPLTREQIEYISQYEAEIEEQRVTNPTLLEDLYDTFQTAQVLYEGEYSFAPGLNIQISSNPEDISIWAAKVIANPAIEKATGKLKKLVMTEEMQEKLSTAFKIVEKHQAIYDLAETESASKQITGQYVIPPFTIVLTYAPELIPEGYSDEDLGIFHGVIEAGKATMQRLENYKIDRARNLIYGKSNSLSFFTVGVRTDEPPLYEIEYAEEPSGFSWVIWIVLFIVGGFFAVRAWKKSSKSKGSTKSSKKRSKKSK